MTVPDWLRRLFSPRPVPSPPPARPVPAPPPAPVPRPVPVPPPVPAPPAPPAPASPGAEVVVRVNAFRALQGLPAYAPDPVLAGLAQAWAEKMAGRYGMIHSGENVAQCIGEGYADPEAIVAGWVSDSPHRAILASRDYTRCGAGAAQSASGVLFWCFDALWGEPGEAA